MSGAYRRLAIPLLAIILAASLLAAIPGCGGTKSVDEIWNKSQEADKNIKSMHMNVSLYYQDTKIGSGLVEADNLDVDGENYHYQKIVLNLSYIEVIRIGDTQYAKVGGGDTWTQGTATTNSQTVVQQTGGLGNLPSLATSQENVGVESVNGVQAYHLVFNLPAQNVSTAFPNYPASELSANTGAKVDVWVDKDKFYQVKFEALINNVLITDKLGNGNKRQVVDMTDINKPITISPPQ